MAQTESTIKSPKSNAANGEQSAIVPQISGSSFEASLARFFLDSEQQRLIEMVMKSLLLRAVEPQGTLDGFEQAVDNLAIKNGFGEGLIGGLNEIAHYLEKDSLEVSNRLIKGEPFASVIKDFPFLEKFALDHGFFPGVIDNLEQLDHERWQAIMFLRQNKQYEAVAAVAEEALGKDLLRNSANLDIPSLGNAQREILHAYNECFDPKNRTFSFRDSTKDAALDASVGNLPWIALAFPSVTAAGLAMEGATRGLLSAARYLIGRLATAEGIETLSARAVTSAGKTAIEKWAAQSYFRRSLVGLGEGQIAIGLAPAAGIGISAVVRDLVINARSGKFFWRDEKPLNAFLNLYLEQTLFHYTGGLAGRAFKTEIGTRTNLGQWVDSHASTSTGRRFLEHCILKTHAQSAALLASSAISKDTERHNGQGELATTDAVTEIIRAYTTASGLAVGQAMVTPIIRGGSKLIFGEDNRTSLVELKVSRSAHTTPTELILPSTSLVHVAGSSTPIQVQAEALNRNLPSNVRAVVNHEEAIRLLTDPASKVSGVLIPVDPSLAEGTRNINLIIARTLGAIFHRPSNSAFTANSIDNVRSEVDRVLGPVATEAAFRSLPLSEKLIVGLNVLQRRRMTSGEEVTNDAANKWLSPFKEDLQAWREHLFHAYRTVEAISPNNRYRFNFRFWRNYSPSLSGVAFAHVDEPAIIYLSSNSGTPGKLSMQFYDIGAVRADTHLYPFNKIELMPGAQSFSIPENWDIIFRGTKRNGPLQTKPLVHSGPQSSGDLRTVLTINEID